MNSSDASSVPPPSCLQLNCRRVRDEPNILEGLATHPLFLGIILSEVLIQAGLVQAGGAAFQTTPLNGKQWGLCVALGASTLLLRAALACWHTEPPQPQQLK